MKTKQNREHLPTFSHTSRPVPCTVAHPNSLPTRHLPRNRRSQQRTGPCSPDRLSARAVSSPPSPGRRRSRGLDWEPVSSTSPCRGDSGQHSPMLERASPSSASGSDSGRDHGPGSSCCRPGRSLRDPRRHRRRPRSCQRTRHHRRCLPRPTAAAVGEPPEGGSRARGSRPRPGGVAGSAVRGRKRG